MKVSVEKKGPCRKVMTVKLPVERVQTEYDQVVQTASRVARIPGFRKGRAPISLVESHYAKAIRDDVQERLVSGSLQEALKQAELDPVRMLELDAELKKGEPLVYRLTVDVAPDFKLPRYKGLSLKEQKLDVTDEMVESSLQRMLEGYATYTPVESQPIKPGDLAQIDFEAFFEGKPLKELGKAVSGIDEGHDMTVMVGPEGVFVPGMDEQLVGLKPGDQKSFDLPFPEKFTVAALAGKTVNYRVTVKAVRERRAAVLDENMLKTLDVENEAKLRDMIRERLGDELQRREKDRLKDELVRILVNKTELELPESLVAEETSRMITSVVRRNLSQGVGRGELEAHRDQIRESAQTMAADRLKTGYILHRIAKEENIQVEDAEFDQELKNQAQRYRMTEEQLRQ
ncbi:MAG: trigger factor, partial [Lentisphaerae bacterium]|nr:trigger factor [Lentisphaerota bacterium]